MPLMLSRRVGREHEGSNSLRYGFNHIKRGLSVSVKVVGNPLTIDSMSDILLPISKTITILVEQLESLVHANCQSTNISEESAELLAEAGHAVLRHSRVLMHELTERRRHGRGASILLSPDAAP